MKRLVCSFLLILGVGCLFGISAQQVTAAMPSQTDVVVTIKEAPPVVPNANQMVRGGESPSSIRGHTESIKDKAYSQYPRTNEEQTSRWSVPLGALLCLAALLLFHYDKNKMERRNGL
ncbi:hypothetical protein [Enterococcus sp. DIV0086]|uniref:hypothetical protein n=1 Tax=Enterococcus sp. DIV0086 TaxID=2774655 RepID=UPI003D2D1440